MGDAASGAPGDPRWAHGREARLAAALLALSSCRGLSRARRLLAISLEPLSLMRTARRLLAIFLEPLSLMRTARRLRATLKPLSLMRTARRLLALSVACLCLCLSGRAQATLRLVPGADGALGAWLVAGPVSGQAAKSVDLTSASAQAGADLPSTRATWRVLGHRGGAIDLRRALGGPGRFAALGGRLEVPAAERVYLLLGLDGSYSVWLNHQKIDERAHDALRGRGFEPIPMELRAGTNELIIWAGSGLPHFALSARVVSQASGLPPAGLRWVLPGGTEAERSRLANELLSTTLELSPTGTRAQLKLTFPYGYIEPPAAPLAPAVTLGKPERSLKLGALPSWPRGTRDYSVSLPYRAGEALEVSLRLGGEARRLTAQRSKETQAALDGAAELEAAALRGDALALAEATQQGQQAEAGAPRGDVQGAPAELSPNLTVDTLRWHQRVVARASPRDERALRARLLAFMERVRGGTPLVEGVQHLALRSRLDGAPQPLSLHLPRGYASRAPGSERARYPLVVLLHGYGSTPERILRVFLDSSTDNPVVDGVVLAAGAHGDAFFRDAGERHLMDVIDWALKELPIDPARVSISGHSMGGTGTAHLALRYPERFSAAAPLAGYHSYFVRRDTSGRPLRSWELEQMHHFSPASWAENSALLPLYVAQGTLDHPRANSQVLIDRLRALQHPVTAEWPEIGHSVWEKVWARAGMWPWLSSKRRAEAVPSSLRLVTSQLRYGKRHFIELLALSHGAALAQVEAKAQSGKLTIKTTGVLSFRLLPPLPAGLEAPLTLEVDGAEVALTSLSSPLTRGPAGWQVKALEAGGKRPGAEGPIRDLLLQPVRVIYGTRRPQTARATREVAERFFTSRGNAALSYPVEADRELQLSDRQRHNLLLIGGAEDNSVSQAFGKQLMSTRDGDALLLRGERFQGDAVGAIYIQPHPDDPTKSVVVIDAVSARGYWLSASLPQLLPDFLVYDTGLLPATGQQVLGSAQVLAGGRFDHAWGLPRGARDASEINPTSIPKR